MKSIGIIYCPNHRPFTTPAKRWEKIAAVLDKYNVEYDMVQSEKASGVERLVTMFINSGYRDIVIAGGDSALTDAVNCLMRQEKHVRDGINLGVIPNGTVNDFASFWGFKYEDIDYAVASLVEHRVRRVDVGCIRYVDKEDNNKQRYFLNCIDVGLLASIQKLRRQTRRRLWSRKLSFAVSLVLMVFQKMEYKMKYTIDYQTEEHHISTLCIGNALGFGQTPNAVPYNGELDVTLVRRTWMLQFVEAIWLYIKGEILNHKQVRPYRTRQVEIESSSRLPVSIDGHPMESPVGKFRITVEQEEINFIIEKK